MKTNEAAHILLSSVQQSLWHLYQFSPESYAFNIGCSFKYPSVLQDKQIRSAISKLINRHKILTMVFYSDNNEIYQQVNEQYYPDYKEIDAGKWGKSDTQLNLNKIITKPFNIEEGPLVRFYHITGLVENESVFLITAHQIVADRRSFSIIKNELFSLLNNPEALLPELKPVYKDYVENQIEYLKSKESEKNLNYWKNLLEIESHLLDIPTDFNRPAIRILQGETRAFLIDNEIRRRISETADETGVDISEIVLFIYFLLLSKLSGENTISIGLSTDDRVNHNINRYIIGAFNNFMPLVIKYNKEQSCFSLIEKIHKQKLASTENSKYPFGLMVEKILTGNDRSRSPFFQSVFNWLPIHDVEDTAEEFFAITQNEGQFDLSLTVEDKGDSLKFQLKYATHLFSEDTISLFIKKFNSIMDYFLDNKHATIDEIPLVSDKEKEKYLQEWNNTGKRLPENYTVHKLFEDQADRTPDLIAAVSGDGVLTYAELESKSNRIAAYLRRKSIKNNDLVGLFIDRSLDMLVALLGILKSGAAYVPLDPSYPAERISYIAADSNISYIITKDRFVKELSFFTGDLVCLDDPSLGLEGFSDDRVVTTGNSGALFNVIYTSGSTGNPKGVEIHHEGVVNFLLSMSDMPGLGSDDIICALTTICFDISILELFGPLCVGARTVILEKEISSDAEKLTEAIVKYDVTILQATPSTLEMLVTSGWRGDKNLRILSTGEPLKKDLAVKLLARSGELWNMYGPTETTVEATCKKITNDDSVISIGKPIANTSIYILDDKMRPLPPGVTGNLYIGGKGVAGGYRNRIELTKEKFIPDPFSKGAEDRLYSTGDKARYLPDGDIVLLGRSDSQLKIRGFRIEPGEIESVLKQHPAVNNAVVAAVESVNGENILAAYIVKSDKEITSGDLKKHCSMKLPYYMIPSVFAFIESIPLTPNNKVNMKALPAVNEELYTDHLSYIPPKGDAESRIAAIWKRLLSIDKVGVNNSFFDIGGTSISASILASELRRQFNHDISVVRIFQYPTIRSMAGFISNSIKEKPLLSSINERISRQQKGAALQKGIAVIGMAGRFPGADSIEALWENLLQGKESVSHFSRDELDEVDEELRYDPDYIPAKGILTDIDKFDAPFFDISANEAQIMDPQQRLMLEIAWASLENAGYSPEQYDGLVGVFAGMGNNNYYLNNIHGHHDIIDRVGAVAVELGMEKDHIAPRISFKMNLKGPSLSIHTACSTTLAVVDSAVNALLSCQCDLALAGGINLTVPQKSGKLYQEGGIFTRDGHCRPFDADATGTMFSEAAGMVVLKRLEDAIADNDTIHAVIRGTAVNHDGSQKASYVAPNIDSQAEVIALAQARGGVHPETIGFIEAHGTATPIGDPIEFEGLTKAFNLKTSKRQYCAIGSVKGNLGHTSIAAGIAGLIKTILVLKHKQIPPSINYKNPNPDIDFSRSPFFVNSHLIDWPENMYPARAGVSAFGYCGTNVHAVLEEPPLRTDSSKSRARHMIMVSAKTAPSLKRMSDNLIGFLKNNPDVNLADVAFTLQRGRSCFNHRKFWICSNIDDLKVQLVNPDPARSGERLYLNSKPGIVFLFPGQGSQYVNMGKTLYRDEQVFRGIVDRCTEILVPILGVDIRSILFPSDEDEKTALDSLKETKFTQPAIFIIEYALSKLWMSWNIRPDAMIGHSIGEFVCAVLAGVFSLEDALRLVAARGRLMQNLPGGMMLSVLLDAETLEKLLPCELSLAAINGPKLCVVSGPTDKVKIFDDSLKNAGIVTKELHSSHAFHSSMMDPIVEPFREIVSSVKLADPVLPFISTVTGKWISDMEATDPGYWANHLRATVNFSGAVAEVLVDNDIILLEVGPRSTSATMARQQIADFTRHTAIASLNDTGEGEMEWSSLLKAIGTLWLWGVDIDWSEFYKNETRRRIPLPTYSFEKIRYWIDPVKKEKKTFCNEGSVVPKFHQDQIFDEISAVEGESSRDLLLQKILSIMQDVSGNTVSDAVFSISFVELGFDSLLLTQIARKLKKELKVAISFRELVEKYSSVNILTDHLASLISKGIMASLSQKNEISAVPERNLVDSNKVLCHSDSHADNGKQKSIIEKLVSLMEKEGVKSDKIAEILSESQTESYKRSYVTSIENVKIMDSKKPPVEGARLGKDENGITAWYVPDPLNNCKYIKLEQ